MKKNKESYFWTSYSDLMTSLFFIMLVLFVLIIVVLYNYHKKNTAELEELTKQLTEQNEGLRNQKEVWEKINELQLQFKELQSSGTFAYLPKSQKYIAKGLTGEIFQPLSSEIQSGYIAESLKVGREIENLLKKLSQYKQFKYQLVLEGNCANSEDLRMDKDSPQWYKLSYERALALYTLWLQNGIDLRRYNTEIMICGSGLNGEDRDKQEFFNKRFVIQIIPKIKPFEKTK